MSELEQAAIAASSIISPAELHGLVCGMSSAQPQAFVLSDFIALAGVDSLADESSVQHFVELALQDFTAQEMTFVPLVADDEEPLALRLKGLAEWCAGYLSGFGAAVTEHREGLPPDVQEILRDFASISGLDEAVEGDEQDESSFAEIFEYVRVASVLTMTLMSPEDADERAEDS